MPPFPKSRRRLQPLSLGGVLDNNIIMYHNNIIHRVAWFLRNPNSPPHRPQPTSQPAIRAHRKMYNPSTPSRQQQQRPNEITQQTERPGLHISNNGFINSKINRFHLCLVRCRVSWRLEVEDSDDDEDQRRSCGTTQHRRRRNRQRANERCCCFCWRMKWPYCVGFCYFQSQSPPQFSSQVSPLFNRHSFHSLLLYT